MGMLDSLLGGMGKQGFDDFTKRYERGAPWDGIGDEETVSSYDTVARQLPQDDYRQAAEASLARLSPDERRELLAQLQGGARRGDMNYPGLHDASDEPGALAGVLSRMHGEQPGLLRQLLAGAGGGGGGAGGLLGSPVAKAALAGIAAMAVKRMTGGGGRGGSGPF